MKADKRKTKACLLCLQEKTNKIGLYSKRGLQLNIFEILIKHLPWLKDEAEKDNKQRICLVCWRVIREFHEFYQSVAKAYKREETYDSNVKLFDNCPASAASEDESFNDPLPAPADIEESKNDQYVAPFEIKLLEDNSSPTPLKVKVPLNDECVSSDIKVEESTFETEFIEEIETSMDKKANNESPLQISELCVFQTGTELKTEIPKSGRALHAKRHSQVKRKGTTNNEFNKNEKCQSADDDSETELPLSMLLPTTLKSSKSKKRGRPVKSKDKTIQIETKETHIKTKSEDKSNNDLTISDDECHFEDNSLSFNANAFDDSDSLSDIDEAERRADIVAPRSPEMPRKKRIRTRNYDTIQHMTQEEKDMKKFEQEKFDEIIAKFFNSFPCPKCNYLVCTFGEMRKHFNSKHSGTQPSVLCCGRRFAQRKMLADHVLVHFNPEQFKCSECGQCLPNSDALKRHEKAHSDTTEKKPTFVCEICSKSFVLKGGLKKHLLMKHTAESEHKYHCNKCQKKFPTKSHFRTHEKAAHRSGDVVMCDQCGKSFTTPKALYSHKLFKHSDNPPKRARVECPICKKKLAKATLKLHTRSMHMEAQNVGECRCHICGYLSVNSRALKLHINYNHVAERKFKCTMCDKAFKKNETLKEHIAMHTGEGVHTCPECQMTFACKANFYKHRQRRHGHKSEKRNLIGLVEKKLQKLKATAKKQVDTPLFYMTDEQNGQPFTVSLVNN